MEVKQKAPLPLWLLVAFSLSDMKKRPVVAVVYCFVFAFAVVTLWLGIYATVLYVQGNSDPSLPESTPCPALNSSKMPNQYQIQKISGWNYGSLVKVEVGALDIRAEHRCFNGGCGSSFLFVNGQLAAFSNNSLDIYDCHGQLLWDTVYDAPTNDNPKLKVYDKNDIFIWESELPDSSKDLSAYGQPDNLLAAVISSDSLVTIQIPKSPAADPRLIIMLCPPPPSSSCRSTPPRTLAFVTFVKGTRNPG